MTTVRTAGHGLDDAALATVVTRVWLAHRLARHANPVNRPLVRELDLALREFQNAGFRVQDHTGERYDPGQALLVVAFETRDVATELVVETLRPSIYQDDDRALRHLQRGEVVVAVPPPDQSSERER